MVAAETLSLVWHNSYANGELLLPFPGHKTANPWRVFRILDIFAAQISITFLSGSGYSLLKGQCYQMNNVFEGLKNQISTFCISATFCLSTDGFIFFWHLTGFYRKPHPNPPPHTLATPQQDWQQLKGNCEPQFILWRSRQSIVAMSNQRSFKIGSFRFAAFVPKKIEWKRF